jgi:hypothetical protein
MLYGAYGCVGRHDSVSDAGKDCTFEESPSCDDCRTQTGSSEPLRRGLPLNGVSVQLCLRSCDGYRNYVCIRKVGCVSPGVYFDNISILIPYLRLDDDIPEGRRAGIYTFVVAAWFIAS